MALDPKLVELLACPKCHGPLEYDPEREVLRCPRCKLEYPIREGIPVLLLEEAKKYE